MKALVVSRHPAYAELLRTCLAFLDYDVDIAGNGPEAMSLLTDGCYTVVLNGNGDRAADKDLYRYVQSKFPSVDLIDISGLTFFRTAGDTNTETLPHTIVPGRQPSVQENKGAAIKGASRAHGTRSFGCILTQ